MPITDVLNKGNAKIIYLANKMPITDVLNKGNAKIKSKQYMNRLTPPGSEVVSVWTQKLQPSSLPGC